MGNLEKIKTDCIRVYKLGNGRPDFCLLSCMKINHANNLGNQSSFLFSGSANGQDEANPVF